MAFLVLKYFKIHRNAFALELFVNPPHRGPIIIERERVVYKQHVGKFMSVKQSRLSICAKDHLFVEPIVVNKEFCSWVGLWFFSAKKKNPVYLSFAQRKKCACNDSS